MSGIHVLGIGAVSPAGWGVAPLQAAVDAGSAPDVASVARPGGRPPLPVRRVPPPAARAAGGHPRLRRASPITHHALAAAREALGDRPVTGRLGVVFCVTAGCVQYSRRFYAEVLADPSTASPLIFPETVFNAPASHLAACLGTSAANDTLVGDGGHFASGLELATIWLQDGVVDTCLVVAAEEVDWLVADAFRRFRRDVVVAEGAGALLLGRDPGPALARLEAVHVSPVFDGTADRAAVAAELDGDLGRWDGPATLRVDGPGPVPDWTGPCRAPGAVLGEALSAGAAWQAVLAVASVADGAHPVAVSRTVGRLTHAGAAVFSRGGPDVPRTTCTAPAAPPG